MIYVYVCEDGHETEKRGGLDASSAPCSVCAKSAPRKPFNLANIVGATVMKEQKYRVSEFQEASAEIDYHYTKAENEGMPVKRPNLYKEGLRRARLRDPKVRVK